MPLASLSSTTDITAEVEGIVREARSAVKWVRSAHSAGALTSVYSPPVSPSLALTPSCRDFSQVLSIDVGATNMAVGCTDVARGETLYAQPEVAQFGQATKGADQVLCEVLLIAAPSSRAKLWGDAGDYSAARAKSRGAPPLTGTAVCCTTSPRAS